MNRKGVIHTVLLMLAVTLLVLPVSGAFAVTSIIPQDGLNTGPVFISNLAGTDLPQDASVNLMLANQTNITGQFVFWESATRITCLLDLAGKKAGTWDVVVVNNTDGSEAVLSPGFTVKNPAPTLTGIDPPVGINNGTVTITNLSGTGFLADATVNLTDGITTIIGTDVDVISGTQIACKFNINGAVPGLWDVVLTNEDGQSAVLTDGFLVTFPPPEVHAITPSTGKNNEVIGITNLSGANFMPGAIVHLAKANESDIPTINAPIVQPGKILCFFDLTDAAVGAWDVVVTNTVDGQSGVLAGGFSIFYPQVPTVTGIDPDNDENDAKVSVLITGTGFEHGAITTLSRGLLPDIPGTNVTRITATAISCDFDITGVETGAWNVTVENDDGQAYTLPGAFVVRNPAPVITDIVPAFGLTSESIKGITLSGTGFVDGASVVLMKGGVNLTAAVITVYPTEVTCTVDLTGAEPGDWSVVLTNLDTQSDVLADAFTVSHPAPEIGTITPDHGVTGETVPATISGNWFQENATVNLTMGAEIIPATVTGIIVSEITCSFDLTGADAGVWDLEVTNPDGNSFVVLAAFTIHDLPPVVTAITPNTGTNGGIIGVIDLAGTNFRDGATVQLMKEGAPNITAMGIPVVESETRILCFFNLTGATVGLWDVMVTNDDGQSGTLPGAFTIFYPAAPVVLGIDPAVAVNTGIVPITNLSGTGFEPGASVTLVKDGQVNITGTEVFVAGPGQITCNLNLTSAAVGLWNIVVTNDDGKSGVLEDEFEVKYPAPGITGFSPVKGINTGNVSITISGEYFRSPDDPAEVRLSRMDEPNIIATSVNVVNSTTITCILPLAGEKVGNWGLVVINPDEQWGIAPAPFIIENPAPTVANITPAKGPNDGPVFISALTGTGFLPNATVLLLKDLEWIFGTNVMVESPTLITCNFNLTGRTTGAWTVAVVNTDEKSGYRKDAFTITPPLPVADFMATPLVGTAPLTVTFTDLSTHDPVYWNWKFGDGMESNQQNPVHTYNKPGVYTVELTVINTAGESLTSATREITVVLGPVASFTIEPDPAHGPAPLFVQFTDTSDGSPTRWFWKFGDGQYSTQQNPYHVYENPGLYTVSLTVSNKAGSNSLTKTNLVEVTSVPVASFTADKTSGTIPLTVKFKDTSTGSPTSWSWKFGDSGNSTEQNPTYVFQNPGSYSVQLTVSNAAGNTSTETKHGYIVVGDVIQANFEFTTSNPENTAPLTVAFTDRSSGRPSSYRWKFGDGYMSSDKNPIHTYTRPGTYEVTLTVTGPTGSSSTSETIIVKSLLRADFMATPTTGSVPLTVTFTDTSIGTPVIRNWAFFDGQSSTWIDDGPKDMTYTFNAPGTYSVLLQVWDVHGADDIEYKQNYITVLPFP